MIKDIYLPINKSGHYPKRLTKGYNRASQIYFIKITFGKITIINKFIMRN